MRRRRQQGKLQLQEQGTLPPQEREMLLQWRRRLLSQLQQEQTLRRLREVGRQRHQSQSQEFRDWLQGCSVERQRGQARMGWLGRNQEDLRR
jgi:hypothetical protein